MVLLTGSRSVTNWEFVLEANGTPKVLGSGAYGTVSNTYSHMMFLCNIATFLVVVPDPLMYHTLGNFGKGFETTTYQ